MTAGIGLNLGLGVGGMAGGAESLQTLLPATDPDVLDTWDLRLGLPSGWTTSGLGSGQTYDSVRGFYSASTGGIGRTSYPSSAAMQSAGAIIIEVERAGIAYDNATRSPSAFDDMAGSTATATASPCLFSCRQGSDFTTERYLLFNQNTTAFTAVWYDDKCPTGDPVQTARISDKVPVWMDQTWATVILTWDGLKEYLIVDGLVIQERTNTTTNIDRMTTINIGCRGGANFWHGYGIRRVQTVKRSLAPKLSALRIGVIGDSFVVRGSSRQDTSAGSAATQAQITGWQSDLALDSTRQGRINQAGGNSGFLWWLQSLAYLRNGNRTWFRIFNAGDAGNGYRSDLNPFGVGPGDALGAWEDGTGPDVILAFGSVNDVLLSNPATASMTTQIESYLTTLAAKCKSLQKLIWFDTFFMPETYATNDTAAHYAEVANQRARLAALNPALVNGSGQAVQFVRVDTWQQWAVNGLQPATHGLGSHPSNGTSTYRTATVNGDVHPTASGMRRIAEIVWPYVRELAAEAEVQEAVTGSTNRVILTGSRVRDFHVRPATVAVDATAATFNGKRLLLAAADRPDGLTITGGTFQNLNIPHTEQGHWCIGPIRDQNQHDYGDVTLDGVTFENIKTQCFHAFGGGNGSAPLTTWGTLTFTDCVAQNVGGEMFYVKGPQTGNITVSGCVLGSYDSRTGWASDHTAFAGDGLDFSHTGIGSWAATIDIQDCEFYNLDGNAIVASSNNVVISNCRAEHCYDPVGTNQHAVLHDPYGPTSSFSIDNTTIISALPDSGINLAGTIGISGTADVIDCTFEVSGNHITTLGRISLFESGNTTGPYTGEFSK